MKKLIILAALALAACSSDQTAIKVNVHYDPSWPLSVFKLTMGTNTADLDVGDTVRVWVPDTWVGQMRTVDLWGLAGTEKLAHGTAIAVPVLGQTTEVDLTLVRVPCGAWCTLGSNTCSGNGVAACEQRDADQCFVWATPTACPASAPFCSLGVCGASCIDECAIGETRCDGPSAVRACGNDDSDKCNDWLPSTPCAPDETCANGVCGKTCEDECKLGDTQCLGAGTITCGDLNGDGCLEWGPVVTCGAGTFCVAGTCTTTCTDECSTNECAGTDFRQCGHFTLSACKTLSPGTSCVPANPCTAGMCSATGCQTAPKVCMTPPVTSCLDASTLRTYSAAGTCSTATGDCDYAHTDTPCPGGCTSGVCAASSLTWTAQTNAVPSNIWAMWGAGANDLYVANSGGTIYHSTGNGTWTSQATASTFIRSLSGTGPSDIYAVGDNGIIYHSTGNGTWSPQTSGTSNSLNGIWGSSPSNVYAVGGGGVILHSTGNGTWSPQTSGTTLTINAVWGSSAGDVYVGAQTGSAPQILRSTGNGTWTDQNVTVGGGIEKIWGSSASDVYAVGGFGPILHSTGDGTWTAQTNPASNFLYSVWGSSASDVYAIGTAGKILHSTGNGTWVAQTSPTTVELSDVWGSSATDVWVAGYSGTVLHLH